MFIQQSATFHMLHATQTSAQLSPLQNTLHPQWEFHTPIIHHGMVYMYKYFNKNNVIINFI